MNALDDNRRGLIPSMVAALILTGLVAIGTACVAGGIVLLVTP